MKAKITSQATREKLKGKYKTIGQIAKDLGGGPEGLKGSQKYFHNALKLFKKNPVVPGTNKVWIRVNHMTEMVDLWHVEEEGETEFETSWTSKQTWSNNADSASSGEAAPNSGTAGQISPTEGAAAAAVSTTKGTNKAANAKKRAKEAPSVGASKDNKIKYLPGETAVDTTKELNAAIKKGKQMKIRMGTCLAAQSDLLMEVNSDPAWTWAASLVDKVRQAKIRLDSVRQKNTFFKTFCLDANWDDTVKKTMAAEAIIAELSHLSVIEQAMNELENEVSKIKEMGNIFQTRTAA